MKKFNYIKKCETCPAHIHYMNTLKAIKKYMQTRKGKATMKRSNKKYKASPKGKACMKRSNKKYRTSTKGKTANKKYRDKKKQQEKQ